MKQMKRLFKMTDTIYVGKGGCKKAYSVTIRERKVNEQGKVTMISITSSSFQIKDISGNTTIHGIKKKLMDASKNIK